MAREYREQPPLSVGCPGPAAIRHQKSTAQPAAAGGFGLLTHLSAERLAVARSRPAELIAEAGLIAEVGLAAEAGLAVEAGLPAEVGLIAEAGLPAEAGLVAAAGTKALAQGLRVAQA
jgi:hypothetical protein